MGYDEIGGDFCSEVKEIYGDNNHHDELGGLKRMGDQMKNGMVLVMSLWDDHDANMLWLDSTYPTDGQQKGSHRGTCSTDSGVPTDVESQHGDSSVKFSDIKYGPIGSSVGPTPTPS